MGKRKRRLHSPKYAKKYASVRETYNRLRGVVESAEADGVITEEEEKEIKLAKEAVVETVVESAITEVAEVIEKIEEVVEPVIEKVAKQRPTIKPRATKRKKKNTKKQT